MNYLKNIDFAEYSTYEQALQKITKEEQFFINIKKELVN